MAASYSKMHFRVTTCLPRLPYVIDVFRTSNCKTRWKSIDEHQMVVLRGDSGTRTTYLGDTNPDIAVEPSLVALVA